VVDVANGNLRGGEAPDETVLHRACPMDRAESWVAKWVVRRTDHAAQLDRLLHLYDESGPDGAVRRTAGEIELRYFTRFELELLLERAGFSLEALFGDYDLTPFGSQSQRLIALAHGRRGKGEANTETLAPVPKASKIPKIPKISSSAHWNLREMRALEQPPRSGGASTVWRHRATILWRRYATG
jgi:hypothetical protein